MVLFSQKVTPQSKCFFFVFLYNPVLNKYNIIAMVELEQLVENAY